MRELSPELLFAGWHSFRLTPLWLDKENDGMYASS